ncbi:hypothetical protein [uncultured Lactobacillus sp.]|uniref:hypothetical protein n=1 Tax=uncultured Lactobacillus sp. TaxID=153152 RepID=UPI00258E686F|nr:hypothetical protein [uncultured Lactobacillus sp.]
MILKQHSKNVKSFVDAKEVGDKETTFMQFMFPNDNNQLITFTFTGESERQELLMQLEHIVGTLKDRDYWTNKRDKIKPEIKQYF